MSNSANNNNTTTATTAPVNRGRPSGFSAKKAVKRNVIRQIRFSEREWSDIESMAANMGYSAEDYPAVKVRAILKAAVANHRSGF